MTRLFIRLSFLGLMTLTLAMAPQLPTASAKQPTSNNPVEKEEAGEEDETTVNEAGEEDGATEDPGEPDEGPEAGEDLEKLRAEYFKLRDRLFQSRARASAVASALYSTRLSVRLDYKSARYYSVTRATIRLDGANIFDDTEGAIGSDEANRFEGYVAPGRHQLSIRIEATGKDDDRFTTIIDNSFVVQASKGKDLDVSVSAQDGGSMPYNWSKKERGSYKLHMNVEVKTLKRSSKKQASGNEASKPGPSDPEAKRHG